MCIKIAGLFWGVSKESPTYHLFMREILTYFIYLYFGVPGVCCRGLLEISQRVQSFSTIAAVCFNMFSTLISISQGQWFYKIIYDQNRCRVGPTSPVISRVIVLHLSGWNNPSYLWIRPFTEITSPFIARRGPPCGLIYIANDVLPFF